MAEGNEIILYQTEDGETKIEVSLDGETVWLSQAQMAELFQTERSVITKHIRNIFQNGELIEKNSFQKKRVPSSTKLVKYYNLDVIISIGYRVNSRRGTAFRIWATRTLREHLLNQVHKLQKAFIEMLESTTQTAVSDDICGYVYVVKSPTGHYKIGRSKDPENRLKTFALKLPFEIEYVHIIPTYDMVRTEAEIHRHFSDKRVNGEWFTLTESDVESLKLWETVG